MNKSTVGKILILCQFVMITTVWATDNKQNICQASGIAAGNSFTCTIVDTDTTKGTVWCWGSNQYGQLGQDISVVKSEKPLQISGLSDVVDIQAGHLHACALSAQGEVTCWGDNNFGQLGDGNIIAYGIPKPESALLISDLIHVDGLMAAGNQSCAYSFDGNNAANGNLLCAGTSSNGLYNWVKPATSNPVAISNEQKFAKDGIATATGGTNHTCIVNQSGHVMCWGYNNFGQLGVPNKNIASNNGVTLPLNSIVKVSSYHQTTCALREDGKDICWGRNDLGQVGNNSFKPVEASPKLVEEKKLKFKDISVGQDTSCGLISNGDVFCWGSSQYGQLGFGKLSYNSGFVPRPSRPVALEDTAISIASGQTHSCAITKNGDVFCWGSGSNGELAKDISASSVPVKINIPCD